MKAKQIVRCIVFMSLVVLLVGCLCRLFKADNNWTSRRFVTFRSLKPDTIDGLYIGSSAVDRYWNCAQGFEEYGLTIYPVAADGSPAWAVKPLIEEALNYQKAKLIIIDIRAFTINVRSDSFMAMARTADVLPFYSLPRWKIVAETEKIMHEKDSDANKLFDINYYLSVGQFHAKWADDGFSLNEFKEEPSDTLGFFAGKRSLKTLSKSDLKKMKAFQQSELFADLDPVMEKSLSDLIEFIKERNLTVLFIDSPHYMSEESSARVNTIKKMLSDQGFDCLQIFGNDMGEYSLDPASDYYNLKHVNYYGSVKYTRFLSEYLLDKYDFWTDHRLDADTGDFDGVLDHIKEKIAAMEKK